MDNHQWMYMGRPSKGVVTTEQIEKTNDFLETAWGQAEGVSCGVPATVVQTRNEKQRWLWANIFSIMDL